MEGSVSSVVQTPFVEPLEFRSATLEGRKPRKLIVGKEAFAWSAHATVSAALYGVGSIFYVIIATLPAYFSGGATSTPPFKDAAKQLQRWAPEPLCLPEEVPGMHHLHLHLHQRCGGDTTE